MKIFDHTILQIFAPIKLINFEATALADAILKEHYASTSAQLETLIPIGVFGSCTQSDIAQFRGVSEALVSNSIWVLEEKGFVKKKADTQDARKVVWSITTKGRIFAMNAHLKVLKESEKVFEVITEAEKKELARMLGKLAKAFITKSPRRELFVRSKNPLLKRILHDASAQ